jgi:hypothetical protein
LKNIYVEGIFFMYYFPFSGLLFQKWDRLALGLRPGEEDEFTIKKNRSGQKLPDLFPTQKTTEDKNVLCAADAQKN